MIVNNEHRYFLWKHAIRLMVINLERLDRAVKVEGKPDVGEIDGGSILNICRSELLH